MKIRTISLASLLTLILLSEAYSYTCHGFGEYCRRLKDSRSKKQKIDSHTCRSELRGSKGELIRRYRAYGQQQGEACRRADKLCEQERSKIPSPKAKERSYCVTIPN